MIQDSLNDYYFVMNTYLINHISDVSMQQLQPLVQRLGPSAWTCVHVLVAMYCSCSWCWRQFGREGRMRMEKGKEERDDDEVIRAWEDEGDGERESVIVFHLSWPASLAGLRSASFSSLPPIKHLKEQLSIQRGSWPYSWLAQIILA